MEYLFEVFSFAIVGILLLVWVIAFFGYYVAVAMEFNDNNIKTKREVLLSLVPFYMWYVKIKDKFNKLE